MASSISPLRLLQPSGTDYIPSSHVLRCVALHTDVASCRGNREGRAGVQSERAESRSAPGARARQSFGEARGG